MKRLLTTLAILAVGATIPSPSSRAQGPAGSPQSSYPFDLGPGEQGAKLRPASEAPGRPAAAPLKGLWNESAMPIPKGLASVEHSVPSPFAINKDIEVDRRAGEWLILLTSYVSDKDGRDKAPIQARKFVAELRGHYKLNAYVYNYGLEENRKERERAESERAKQREALRKEGLPTDVAIRVRVNLVDESTGVLIGGYKTRDEALNDLKQRIRKLPTPDPKKVDLHIKYFAEEVVDPMGQSKFNVKEGAYVNPFSSAFPVRNPTLPKEGSAPDLGAEVEYLRKINAGEAYSLLACKKKFTLAIKQYNTIAMLQENPNDAKAFLQRLSRNSVDYAADNAHKVAEGFRKVGLKETYVLHTRYCSYVTVGGYDGPEDPALKAMQTHLQNYFSSPAMQPLDMMPQPVPLEVPH